MSGSVYTVASGKGGVGKTTTTVNLGVAVWQEGNSVAVVDADLGMANLSAVLGLDPERTLHDVLAGETILEEAIVEAKGGDLLVLPGSRELAGFAAANPQKLKDVLENLAARCDYVIVDTGAGLGYEDVLPLGLADAVILVSSADPASLGDTRKTAELAALVETPVLGAVVTRAVEGTDSEAIAAEIGAELLGTVPEDPSVMEATVAGDPLASHAPNADATAAYMELGRTVLGAEIPAVPEPEPSEDEPESAAPGSDEPTSPEGDEEGPEAVDAVTEGDESVDADEEPVDEADDEPEPSPEEAAADESEPAADETSDPVPADGAEAADSNEPHAGEESDAEGETDADAPEEASPAPGAAEDDTDADEPAQASGGTDEPEPAADDSEEAADESADAEPAEDESGDDEPVEDESVDDAPADEATADAGSAESGPGDEDDGDEDTQDPPGGRSGGLRGWLGRLFS